MKYFAKNGPLLIPAPASQGLFVSLSVQGCWGWASLSIFQVPHGAFKAPHPTLDLMSWSNPYIISNRLLKIYQISGSELSASLKGTSHCFFNNYL